MPERIQRRRVKGWRMPEGAVYVGRGTKWGNPFKFHDRTGGLVRHLPGKPSEYEYEGRISADGMRHDYFHPDGSVTEYRVRWATRQEVVDMFERTLTDPDRGMLGAYPSGKGNLCTYWTGGKRFVGELASVTPDLIRAELAGKDLACWCPTWEPCHADVLLRIANSPIEQEAGTAA